jgi:hypothetical protein
MRELIAPPAQPRALGVNEIRSHVRSGICKQVFDAERQGDAMTAPRSRDRMLGMFTREDFERAWRGPDDTSGGGGGRQTAIMLRHVTAHDHCGRSLSVSIDDEPPLTLACGERVTLPVMPGPHSVCIRGLPFRRTLLVEVERGRRVRVLCGMRVPRSRWLARIVALAPWFGLWIARE